MEEEEVLYEPEYIVDMKVTSGRCFYLIKWKDFPMSDCTWEPTENLINCEEHANDVAFCKEPSKEGTSDINASERLDFSTVATLVCREQHMYTIRFKAKLDDGSSVWISDKDAHMHLKDRLIEFYERILNLKPLET
uniref:Chromo domain-containing protein n=1 Tax=Elaeophora elaphi TaxID=1147741 RepID=A0A0R3S4D0_9BILA